MEQLQTRTGESTPLSGALRNLLAANLGRYVVAEFVTGAECMTQKSGVLTAVETEYLILFDEVCQSELVADLASLRFITFCSPDPGTPAQEGNGIGLDGTANGTGNTVSENTAVPNSVETRQSTQDNGGLQKTPGSAPGAVEPVMAPSRVQSQAALNYAKRKARKLN